MRTSWQAIKKNSTYRKQKAKKKKGFGTKAAQRKISQKIRGKLKYWAAQHREKMTPAESWLWLRLQDGVEGLKFKAQHPWGNKYILDFACTRYRVCVEVDGGYHGDCKDRDSLRDWVLGKHGWRTVRFTNEQVLWDVNAVVAEIAAIAKAGHKRKRASKDVEVRYEGDLDGGQAP